ncbi:MAG: hypothetical protein K0S57_165 [Ramlibacter sp.]|jgi:hypothetical protein|nr:hypothetical protein [Ramlibacter sp.]
MSPPPKNDWWLAAALSSAAVPGALAQQAPVARPEAVVTTVARPGAAQPGVRHTQIAANAVQGQRLVTDGQTAIHVLFADQSALTVGPNSEVLVQQYRFDEKARDGRILVQITKGFLRMVGGAISKRNPVTVVTPTATIGIRGGISIVRAEGDTTDAAFLFGDELSMEHLGNRASVYRPGFGLSAGPSGMSQPSRDVFERTVSASMMGMMPSGPSGLVDSSGLIGVVPVIDLVINPVINIFDGDVTPPDILQLLDTPGPGNQS